MNSSGTGRAKTSSILNINFNANSYTNNYTHNVAHQVYSDTSNQDIAQFFNYMSLRISQYEENINNCYINIKTVICIIEEEYQQIDINNFSDFLAICEEYYNLIQHSKSVITKSEEIYKENEKMKKKIDKLNGKKIAFKSSNENLLEENRFKDIELKKLEDELANLKEEYIELSYNLNQNTISSKEKNEHELEEYKSARKISLANYMHNSELKTLNDERNNLQRENGNLFKRIEMYENDMKTKFISKIDAERKIIQLETEKNQYFSKMKIYEINMEKMKKEIQNLLNENGELSKDLDKNEKRLEECLTALNNTNSNGFFNSEDMRGTTTLNTLLDDDMDEIFKRKTISKLRKSIDKADVSDFKYDLTPNKMRSSQKKIMTDKTENIIEEVNESSGNEETNQNQNENGVRNYLSMSSDEENNKTLELRMTNVEIVKSMNKNEFTTFVNKNANSFSKMENNFGRASLDKKVSIINNHSHDLYKEFFMLTYQSLKLCSDNIEPFLYVK